MTTPDFSSPFWADYRSSLERWFPDDAGDPFPDTAAMNRELPEGTVSGCGRPIRFVPAAVNGAVDYERYVFDTGQVSTRQNNCHDLFNSLVWSRFPHFKAAINTLHVKEMDAYRGSGRGPVRDALTLFDECGAVVISDHAGVLDALAHRDWRRLFVDLARAWQDRVVVLIVGHALLEKLLTPYKAITAQTLRIRMPSPPGAMDRPQLREKVSRVLAKTISAGHCLRSTADLTPLPLMGIPGWRPEIDRDTRYYADQNVFRPPPAGFVPNLPLLELQP